MFFRKSRPAAERAAPLPCKICGCDAGYVGAVDFSKNCERIALPASGIAVPYHHCANCGFLFTGFCDRWSGEEFAQRIYNADYARIDPDFTGKRPREEAGRFAALIAPLGPAGRVLDYGGGSGQFTRHLRERGFDAASYDPFHDSEFTPAAGERFDLLHCCEVMEHAADPQALVADIAGRMSDNSAAFISTMFVPRDFDTLRLEWWYVGPRNGHISIFSMRSLSLLWNEAGFKFGTFDGMHHLAWRGEPASLPCFTAGLGPLHQL